MQRLNSAPHNKRSHCRHSGGVFGTRVSQLDDIFTLGEDSRHGSDVSSATVRKRVRRGMGSLILLLEYWVGDAGLRTEFIDVMHVFI